MKKLIFRTLGELDLNVIRLMGVSVKESDNPIGRFGTGLKYAIATILREGGNITIITGGNLYTFGVVDIEVRGKTFSTVTMGGEQLGFTTELGKDWEPWMAVRELYSNTLDEGGSVAVAGSALPEPDTTTIIVSGDSFLSVWSARDRYFLDDSEPMIETPYTKVYRGKSSEIFYQGIRVAEIRGSSLFKYNIVEKVNLTEDRTLKYNWQLEEAIEKTIIVSDDEKFIRGALTTGEEHLEGCLDFNDSFRSIVPSEAFCRVIESFLRHTPRNANRDAIKWYQRRFSKPIDYRDIELDDIQRQQLHRAKECMGKLGLSSELENYHIRAVETLGEGVLGLAQDGQILIAKDCFKKGTKYLFSTLYEEFIHCHRGYKDHTRELQTYLFDEIVDMTERYVLREAI